MANQKRGEGRKGPTALSLHTVGAGMEEGPTQSAPTREQRAMPAFCFPEAAGLETSLLSTGRSQGLFFHLGFVVD